jgi:hypothetical protein
MRIMMPYDTYRLYRIERVPGDADIRHADEQAGRLAAAVSSLVRGLTRRVPAARTPYPAGARTRPRALSAGR